MKNERTEEIGFVGLGVMGAGMAATLAQAGFTVRGYDIFPEKIEELTELGVTPTRSLADVEAPVVLLSLPRALDVEVVLFGDPGLASILRPKSIIADTSTIAATASQSYAKRLAEKGIRFIDAPVSGGKQGAAEGMLSCMVGGPVDVFTAIKPILSEIAGAALVHIGPNGAGLLCKACNQIVQAGTMLGIAESIALCHKAEIDPETVRQAMMGGAARSFMLENHAKRLIEGTFAPGFRSELMLKDLAVVLETCRENQVFAPLVALAQQLFTANCARERGAHDWSSIGLLHQEMSGADVGAQMTTQLDLGRRGRG